jgi:hypothetical protein
LIIHLAGVIGSSYNAAGKVNEACQWYRRGLEVAERSSQQLACLAVLAALPFQQPADPLPANSTAIRIYCALFLPNRKDASVLTGARHVTPQKMLHEATDRRESTVPRDG